MPPPPGITLDEEVGGKCERKEDGEMEIDNDKVQDSVMLELAAVGLVGMSREVGNFGEYLMIKYLLLMSSRHDESQACIIVSCI